MKHGIIIPCYNEASRLNMKSFIDFAANYQDVLLCFVNDGSKDATRSALADIRNDVSENVYTLNVEQNAGKANAVREGALFLFEETDVDTVGFLDADLSTSFSDYQTLLDAYEDPANNLQIVFGSRNINTGGNNIERNPVRKLISDFIRMLIITITKLNIKDTQCGAKVFDRHLIPLIYDSAFYSKWLFDVEILLRLKSAMGKMRFMEVFLEKPLNAWTHMEGSKLGMKDSIMIPFNLLKIWMEYDLKPMVRRLTNKNNYQIG